MQHGFRPAGKPAGKPLRGRMESDEYLRGVVADSVGEGKAFRNRNVLAEAAGVNPGNLSRFMKGHGAGITFETAWKLLKVTGYLPDGKSGRHVPMYFANNTGSEGPKLSPCGRIVLPQGFSASFCLRIDESVPELSIEKGSILGITDATRPVPGCLCLVLLPFYGLALRRTFFRDGSLIFRLDQAGEMDIVMTASEGSEAIRGCGTFLISPRC